MRKSSSRTPVPAILVDTDDAGRSSTRLMFAGHAYRFRAEYKFLSAAEAAAFESFYATNAALTPTMTWRDGVTYTVNFIGEGVNFDQHDGSHWGGYALFQTVAAS